MRIFILASLLCASASSALAQSAGSDSSATFKMDGKAGLTTHFVEHGVSHSDKDPALQGEFWFNWGPQFRMGLWGSNVAYTGSDTHFLLRINGDIKVNFSQDSSLVIKYSDQHFFKPEDRDGNVVGFHLNLFGYGVRYEMHSNFFGTGEKSTSYAFAKTWDVFGTWKWENAVGYMMMTSESLSNFFWYETYLGTQPGSILYQIGASYNSGASQFNGAGDLAFVLKATVSF